MPGFFSPVRHMSAMIFVFVTLLRRDPPQPRRISMARERYDDEGDDRPIQKKELSGLDAMYANTNIVVLILFSLCCGIIALVLNIIALVVCTDEKAKSNAKIGLIVSIVAVLLGCIGGIINGIIGGAGQP